jgi:hypothetical protein
MTLVPIRCFQFPRYNPLDLECQLGMGRAVDRAYSGDPCAGSGTHKGEGF